MSREFLITIDQGTTGSRVFLFDAKANVLASSYEEFTQYFPKAGWVEHDAEEIWASVDKLLKETIKKSGLDPKNTVGIGITNQRETALLWEKSTGKPIHRAVVWQCRRTSDFCDELKKQGSGPEVQAKTGLVIDAYFSGTKINWLLKNIPKALVRAKNGELLCGTIDSYLLYRLTGGEVHRTDQTNASRTMLYNIHEKKWDEALCKLLDIPMAILPQVIDTASLFGKTKGLSSLPDSIPIYSMVGDQQAALFGQLCLKPGDVKNTYGTGCFMLMNTGEKYFNSKNGLITTLACNEKGEPVYALEGSVFIAGAVVQFLRDSFKFFNEASKTEEMAFSISELEDEIVFVPAFAGLGSPYWDQNARGAIFGLTRDTNPEQVTRAALKSIALQSKDLLDSMQQDSGNNIKALKVDGGAANNTFLMKYQSAILNVPVLLPGNTEMTVLGAAYLAGIASGFWNSADELKGLNPIAKEFVPDMFDDQKRKKEINLWKRSVKKVLTS